MRPVLDRYQFVPLTRHGRRPAPGTRRRRLRPTTGSASTWPGTSHGNDASYDRNWRHVRCRVQTRGGARRLSVGNWQLDPYHTQVEFSAKHLAMMTVRGY